MGDLVYGTPAINRILHKSLGISRQLLHCRQYTFFDAMSQQKRSFEAPLPADFEKLFEK
ncbi:MAG: hypothetical protein WCJ39_08345 [bacterium]